MQIPTKVPTEYEHAFRAMGTECAVSVVHHSKEEAERLASSAQKRIADYEQRFSRFLPASELTRLNTEKHLHVSPLFLIVLETALLLHQKTQGYFNPLVQIARFGYVADFAQIDTYADVPAPAVYDTDISGITIDTTANTVTLRHDQTLDFGGFLKGYASHAIACELAAKEGVTGVIVNLGGDIHTEGLDARGNPFEFLLYNPVTQEDTVLTLHNESLATSGTYARVWGTKTKTHHILDRAGMRNPRSPIVSASVVHMDGACADAYTKAFIAESGRALLLFPHEALRAILITNDGTVTHLST